MESFEREIGKHDAKPDTFRSSSESDKVQGAQKDPTDVDCISPDKSTGMPAEHRDEYDPLQERPGSASSYYDCFGNMCDCCVLIAICFFDGPNNSSSRADSDTNEKQKRRKGGSGYYAMTDFEAQGDDTFGWGQAQTDIETTEPGLWCSDTLGGDGGGDCGCGEGGGE